MLLELLEDRERVGAEGAMIERAVGGRVLEVLAHGDPERGRLLGGHCCVISGARQVNVDEYNDRKTKEEYDM